MLEFILITALINTGLADVPTLGEREKIVDFHNWLRANVIPSASNMKKMVNQLNIRKVQLFLKFNIQEEFNSKKLQLLIG